MRMVLTATCLAMLACHLTLAVSAQIRSPITPGARFRDCPDCPEMVVVPAGKFMMGSVPIKLARSADGLYGIFQRWAFATAQSHEQPEHEVSLLHPFALGHYQVTRGEFTAFVKATGYQPEPGCVLHDHNRFRAHTDGSWLNPGFDQSDLDPVVCVNVADAEAYIAWLNHHVQTRASEAQVGPYRLPSEAEWEYAARAGTTTARWWGDEIGVGNADCGGCGSPWDDRRTAPVNSFRDNPFGISGVLGNASEWTGDCWNLNYASAPSNGSKWSVGDCSRNVMRGDSAVRDYEYVRSSSRSNLSIGERSAFTGFRVAKDDLIPRDTKHL